MRQPIFHLRESEPLKIKHILLLVVAVLTIAFMQPLVSFLGGLTLLIGVGGLIFRDLSPASQDVVERRLLGWLHRTRATSPSHASNQPSGFRRQLPDPAQPKIPAESPRRARSKSPIGQPITADPAPITVTETAVMRETPPPPTA